MNEAIQIELNRAGLSLFKDENGLFLSDGDMTLRVDFSSIARRVSSGGLKNELLIKACKVKAFSPFVVDATAGLGEDSMLLAAAGYDVVLYEKNPVIALLLKDALACAHADKALGCAARRMQFIEADSIEAMHNLPMRPDVIYLDPMFPERKKSAAVKKKFQLLHRLEAPCDDEDALLYAAIDAKPSKVVIKRPLKASFLGDIKPSYSLQGKAIRYDCIVLT